MTTKKEQRITVEMVKEMLIYEPHTGEFIWRRHMSPRIRAGAPAGFTNLDGYVYIGINGDKFSAHRLAWLISTGSWPKQQIDHINGNRGDNRFSNLRDVSNSTNGKNRVLRKDNKVQMVGISWCDRNKWRVQVSTDSGRIRRNFANLEDAIRARDQLYLQHGYTHRHLNGGQP